MATDGVNDAGESRRRIILDNVIYEPVSSVVASRQQRSQVLMYNDSKLKRMPPYKHKPLQSMRRRLRLLRLHGGGLDNPEITCELFEVEYDKDDHNTVGRVLSKDEQSAKREGYEKRRASQKTPNNFIGSHSLDVDDDVVEYESLSWCWGQEVKDRAIRIQEGGRYYRLAITRDLALALKHLRHRYEERILWIDALCIDQANHEERNHQVQMMARIYSGAKQVCIWLGEDTDESTTAIGFMKEIVRLEDFDTISENKENASKWQSLLLFMQRPWFSRRWVVQEIALARSATIYCGKENIPWLNFAVAVELFVEAETATHRLSEVVRQDKKFGHVPQWFEHVSELGASVLVQATGKVFQRDGTQTTDLDYDIDTATQSRARQGLKSYETRKVEGRPRPSALVPRQALLSLEYLVSSLSLFQATQPRDTVYSLLAIARDTVPFAEAYNHPQEGSEEESMTATVLSALGCQPFRIDYSRTYSDVCQDFVSFCAQVNGRWDPTKALDILCRPWAPELEVTAGGVAHRKPTQYKFLSFRERLPLWPVGRDRRPTFHMVAEYHPIDIICQIEDPDQRIGAPILRKSDRRNKAQYWRDCEKDWSRCGDRVESFERDVKPFLPKRRKRPKKAGEKQHDDPVTRDRSKPGEERNGFEDEEQNEQDRDTSLPSWVSHLSGAPFALYRHPGMSGSARIGRLNADPLVGLPEDRHKNYNAARNTTVDYHSGDRLRFRKRPKSGHRSLFTKGFILAKVESVAEPARLAAIPATWIKFAGWDNALDGQTDPPAEFWRTLVADRGKEGRNPPYHYATACKESVKRGGLLGGAVDTGALISMEGNSIIAEYCRRVQAVIWNRCLIKTDKSLKQGVLGLASQHVHKDDLVCIIFGCTVPVILRRYIKQEGDLEKEKMQDQIESMKAAMHVCEETCVRKLRYQRRLQKEREKGEGLDTIWKREVLAELEDVNSQMRRWREREEEDKRRERAQDREQDIRKKDAERRQSIAKKRRASATRQPQQNRSNTMPDYHRFKSMASDTASVMVDEAITEDPEGVGGTNATLPQTHGQDTSNHNETREPKSSTPDQLEAERQERKNKAKEEDPNVYYQFIGEAYIHGMMDGEAVRLHINEGIPRRMFEIR